MTRSYSPPPEADALGPLDRVEELLGECLAEPQAQWPAAIERLCDRHPTEALALRRRFAALQRAGLMHEPGSQASDLALVRALAQDQPEIAAALADAAGVDRSSVHGLPTPTDARLGTTLSKRYRLVARIGAGAMGVVYRSHDEELRREVAVKLLDAGQVVDPKAEARFLQEAELLAGLRHDAIVTLHDRGRSERGELFLVMELLDGVPLTRVLQAIDGVSTAGHLAAVREVLAAREAGQDAPPAGNGKALPESSVVRLIARWGAELAEGLAVAHAAGVLHRDIKPSNVFVRRDGRAVLLDFGIATRGGDLTAAGTVLGTPWYMAPEQATAQGKLTPALDVYGLSSCLYHLLSGRPPFEGDPLAVLARIARDDPPRLSAVKPDLARDLRAIVETGMARAPRDRYASMVALASDLRAFLEHRPITARPLSSVGRLWRSAKRRPARAALIAAALVIATLSLGLQAARAREAARSKVARKTELMARLPETLAFEGLPEQRLLASVRPEHTGFLAELDEIVALDPDDLPPLLWRAALRLDEGQHEAAAQDLAHAAQRAPTPYLAAVAARYQRAARDRRGTESIDLANIDATPNTPADCFVAGFHELRNRHIEGFAKRADELLTRAAEAYPPARDLRLVALVARGDYEDPLYFITAVNESLRLEGVYGRGTARTYALRGAALAAMGRNKEALAPLQKALEMRPGRHSPLQNLAVVHRALGNTELAKKYIDAAYAARPYFWNTTFLRAQIMSDAGEFAAACELVAGIDESDAPDLAWRKPYLLATIGTEEVATLYRRGATAAEREAVAARAFTHLDTVCAHPSAPDGYKQRAANRRAIIQALLHHDDEGASIRFLRQLTEVPNDAAALRNLAALLPERNLSERAIAHLRLFLATLAHLSAVQDNRQQLVRDDARKRVNQLESTDTSTSTESRIK